MLPNRTAKGMTCSAITGVRNRASCAISPALAFSRVAGPPHQLDEIERVDERENGREDKENRLEKLPREIPAEGRADDHVRLSAVWTCGTAAAPDPRPRSGPALSGSTDPCRISISETHDGEERRSVDADGSPRGPDDGARGGKSGDAEDHHGDDRRRHRDAAPLPGRAGVAESRERDRHHGQGIEPGRQPVVQLGAEAALLELVEGLVLVGEQQLRRPAFARLVDDLAAILVEGREVDRVAVEGHDGAVLAVRLLALDTALFEDQIGLAVRFDGLATLREIDHDLVLIPLIFHEDSQERVAGALAVMERDAVIEGDELALLRHGGDEIGPDLGHEVAQLLEARRHDVNRDHARR